VLAEHAFHLAARDEGLHRSGETEAEISQNIPKANESAFTISPPTEITRPGW